MDIKPLSETHRRTAEEAQAAFYKELLVIWEKASAHSPKNQPPVIIITSPSAEAVLRRMAFEEATQEEFEQDFLDCCIWENKTALLAAPSFVPKADLAYSAVPSYSKFTTKSHSRNNPPWSSKHRGGKPRKN
jgi:hypothetical protein